MADLKELKDFIKEGEKEFLPHVSLDCVVLGFHENELKVLLLKMKQGEQWSLAGGFIRKDEPVDKEAYRVLKERTGLNDIFLQQFHLFGNPGRSDKKFWTEWFLKRGLGHSENWLTQRFVTVGYYALVEYSQVSPKPDSLSDACRWFDLRQLPPLIMDHSQIIQKAIDTVRLQLNYQPIGYNLLPKKFTMPQLQKLYETVLDRSLDRRNFQRRILGYGILRRLKERKKGGAHKAPYLYSFDLRKYHNALKDGLQGGW
ncbi:MAG: NUDIX hydrolase [Bacteroidetes bacterium]|nr:MAG: NUDIX hydrolase [Bacteroidota bacterium]